MSETLDVQVSPQALFDVELDDEAALQIEATRVRALLQAVAETSRPPTAALRSKANGAGTPANALREELAALDPALWSKRLELDRARLSFYELSAEKRAELLAAHQTRQVAAQPKETEEERQAREAQVERERALQAAKTARSEAERLVSEEVARLIALEARVRGLHDKFNDAHDEIKVWRDTVLGWQRRIREAKTAGASETDVTYDALRRTLRGARNDLAAALDALNGSSSTVPMLHANPLVDVPPDIATDSARQRRHAAERAIAEARTDERRVREERASALLDEINTLNRERLGLLPYLSPSKRAAITGFTVAGLDQARSEARHLSLILQYHQHVARSWLRTVKNGGGVSPWRTAFVVLPALVVVAAFFWLRKKTRVFLRWSELRLAASDRAERRTVPGVGVRTVRVLLKTHRSIEWILFFLCLIGLLPSGARRLLELQLVSSVASWSLAGSLVINTVDALAAGNAAVSTIEDRQTGELRLRSLRLVGRTVVVFALILVLSARLVGQGTIYSWVFSTCWFAAIPLFLLLARWWRGTVFERLDRLRRKTPL